MQRAHISLFFLSSFSIQRYLSYSHSIPAGRSKDSSYDESVLNGFKSELFTEGYWTTEFLNLKIDFYVDKIMEIILKFSVCVWNIFEIRNIVGYEKKNIGNG